MDALAGVAAQKPLDLQRIGGAALRRNCDLGKEMTELRASFVQHRAEKTEKNRKLF